MTMKNMTMTNDDDSDDYYDDNTQTIYMFEFIDLRDKYICIIILYNKIACGKNNQKMVLFSFRFEEMIK